MRVVLCLSTLPRAECGGHRGGIKTCILWELTSWHIHLSKNNSYHLYSISYKPGTVLST